MLDIHTHVLPHMDDGSGSVEESLELLAASAAQGISLVAATPHYYAVEESPEQFLQRRARAAARVRDVWRLELPQLIMGAEVYYFEGMSAVEELRTLCLEGTDLLLLEMPFSRWTDRMIKELLDVSICQQLQVVLAHVERYVRFQPASLWAKLLDAGVLFQCNAGFFCDWRTRWRALQMLKNGQIHFLGSDCHNMGARPPRLGKALAVIGERERSGLEENIRRYFPMLEG